MGVGEVGELSRNVPVNPPPMIMGRPRGPGARLIYWTSETTGPDQTRLGYVACEYRNFPIRGRITSTKASHVEPHIAAHNPHHLLLRNDLDIPLDSVRKPVWKSGTGRLVG